MRIGILSDTHDRRDRAALAVSRLVSEGAEALIHCGDLTTPEIVYELAARPCFVVLGNCDFDRQAIEFAVEAVGGTFLGQGGEIEMSGRRLAVTHGHDRATWVRLLSAAPDYLFYGHTHVADDRLDGPTRLINPGALQRAKIYSAVLLDLHTGTLEFLKIG